MLNILKTEWLKIKRYPAFWWVMGITVLTYPGINYMFYFIFLQVTQNENQAGQIAKMLLGNPFALPEAWHTIAWCSSLFIFIPAIVIIMLITNEYTYKTNRQNIIEGWSRNDFMKGKLMNVVVMTVLVTLLYTLVAFIVGLLTTTDTAAAKWSLAYYIGLFALQSFAQLSLAFLVGFLVRKSFIALAVFTFYFIIVEPISVALIRKYLHSDIGNFFPLKVSHRLIPAPAFIGKIDEKDYLANLDAVKYHVGYTLVMVLLTWAFCFWLNKRRDL